MVPAFNTDSLAMALIGLSLQEERFGSLQKADRYVDRATQLIRPRVGTSRIVEAFLQYVRYLMAPRVSEIPPDGGRWLVTFVHSAEKLMAQHNTSSFLSLVPQRSTIFQFESPLHTLLSSGPHPTLVPTDDRVYVVPSNLESWRTAALIYITTALWDFRDSPDKIARFLDHLLVAVRENHLDRSHACESLVWILLREMYDPDMRNPERSWSTGELLRTHKLLDPDLQFKFNEILLSFLALKAPIGGVDSFEREIFQSGLWCYDSLAHV
jgi:hypothetical protein